MVLGHAEPEPCEPCGAHFLFVSPIKTVGCNEGLAWSVKEQDFVHHERRTPEQLLWQSGYILPSIVPQNVAGHLRHLLSKILSTCTGSYEHFRIWEQPGCVGHEKPVLEIRCNDECNLSEYVNFSPQVWVDRDRGVKDKQRAVSAVSGETDHRHRRVNGERQVLPPQETADVFLLFPKPFRARKGVCVQDLRLQTPPQTVL
mmetsp:Transcript_36230/g.71276  ORF Transcript_36230/g.71276 Transcript_36230/m.71276 type:complete len:201 (-) Transcript_36230:142-744(-)